MINNHNAVHISSDVFKKLINNLLEEEFKGYKEITTIKCVQCQINKFEINFYILMENTKNNNLYNKIQKIKENIYNSIEKLFSIKINNVYLYIKKK